MVRYVKPIMTKKMSNRLKRGIKNYKDADKFYKEFGVTPSYAQLMYRHPKKSTRKKK